MILNLRDLRLLSVIIILISAIIESEKSIIRI